MKKHIISGFGLWIACAAISSAHTFSFDINVQNPSKHPRTAQPVVLQLSRYADFCVKHATVKANGKEIPSQLDDLDGDLKADELAFVTPLPGSGSTTFTITLSDKTGENSYDMQTNAYIKLNDIKGKHPEVCTITYPGDADILDMYNSIYGHGAVFENQYIAYRIYMDHRQSIDLYGKTHPRLEMDVTGFYTSDEQLAQGYGCDILWAGQSVGAGSFRGYRNEQPCYIDTVAWRQQTIVAKGPVRSIVEVTDKHWQYNGRELDMKQRYTLYVGRRDVAVEIHIDNAPVNETYCTGIQKLEEHPTGFIQENGLSGSWGFNVPEKSAPEHHEGVGLGLYAHPANRKAMKEDAVNYLTLLQTDENGNIRYTIATCAEREKDGFKNADEWFTFLKQWQEETATPCIIRKL